MAVQLVLIVLLELILHPMPHLALLVKLVGSHLPQDQHHVNLARVVQYL